MENLLIRKVETADIEQMILHRVDYLTEMQGKHSEEEIEKLKSGYREYFVRNIGNGNFMALVAELDHVPVAYGAMVFRSVPGDFSQSVYTEADILNMYTVPNARKQGISRLILNELISIARSMGISKLALHTSKDGEHLYRSSGFHEPQYPFLEIIL